MVAVYNLSANLIVFLAWSDGAVQHNRFHVDTGWEHENWLEVSE